jgi:septum formation protein
MSCSALILASSSPFRRELLERLQLPFESISPQVDESRHEGEPPNHYVQRLARLKARAIAADHPRSIVIGSDQCAYLDGAVLGKPGDHQHAVEQLQAASGRQVVFYTGLCVSRLQDGFEQTDCIEYQVGFRDLSACQIERYLQIEQPYNCAGSFKSEGLGVALFSHMRGDDPSALVGLPLIRLVSMLEQAGCEVLRDQ